MGMADVGRARAEAPFLAGCANISAISGMVSARRDLPLHLGQGGATSADMGRVKCLM